MAIAITTGKLRKEYDGVIALQSLDLEIPRGEIYGLIGPNGAGKTTLLKILSTSLRPDFGAASVAGCCVETDPLGARRRVGYMPDFFALYDSMTAEDFLTYFALAFDVPRANISARVNELLAMVSLAEKRNAQISELSRGMKQRLVIARALVHDPDVLLLDEPLSGLDPKSRAEVREILRSLREKGKTIIISSHILAEMSDFCTSVGIIEKGILRISGSVEEIRARMTGVRQITVEVAADAEKARAIISACDGATLERGEGSTLKFTLAGDRLKIAEINRALVSAGVPVLAIGEERGGIEDIYFQVAAHGVQ